MNHRSSNANRLCLAGPLLSILLLPLVASAQDSSLLSSPPPLAPGARPVTLESVSLLYTPPEPLKVLQLHDIVTVVVNINSRMQSDGEIENRKRANLDAILANWVGLDGFAFVPDPQADGDPQVTGNLNSQFRAEGELKAKSSLAFTIAAEVVDVRPNGTLVIEARKEVTINEEVWQRSLIGVIRREDVTPDNKVQTEDIANLRIYTYETGQVRDGYRRGWLQQMYDRFQPF